MTSESRKLKNREPLPSWRAVLAAVCAYKALELGLVWALSRFWPQSFHAGNYWFNFHWPFAARPDANSFFQTWDAQHFLYLARYGYSPGAVSDNFFPLWPWLIRCLASWSGGNFLVSALILANAFSIMAALLIPACGGEGKYSHAGVWALAFMLAYPGALFLQFPYAEALFILLAAAMLLALFRRSFAWAAAAAFLMSMARPQGILAIPAYWYGLWKGGKTGWRTGALWAAPLAGFAAYLAFMHAACGWAWHGFDLYARLFPEKPSAARLLDLSGFVRGFFHVSSWHDYQGALTDRIWFLLFIACLPGLWKRNKTLFLYALPMGLVPAFGLSLVSFMRHMLLAFPVFFVLADFFAKPSRRGLAYAALGALVAAQVYFVILHAENYWVA